MTSEERALLLSVRPRFAESIMDGTKIAELRRKRPDVQPGTPVIIYATQPVAAVVGAARIADIFEGTPAEIWANHHTQVGVSKDELETYLFGSTTAYVLLLTDVHRLRDPLTLSEMRATAAFHPPRSYRYLTGSMLHRLVNGHPGGDSLLALLPTTTSLFNCLDEKI